ncbi:GspH/FimT family pseudopilin [Ottowia caeni]|uniref:GspH/FimT family pseudopilin n=1 Tax=Ottowia caeni TaxID=2870339 RepID=UPI001E394EC1|nr:GspH/FimT family pseudopilin [Ottowia caeni]
MSTPKIRTREPHYSKGVTAIELLVTLAVLAILLGVAAPAMSRFINQWQVANATNAFTGSLRTARTEAIARVRPVVMCRVANNTSNACLTAVGTNGFASGWIVFVNNDRDGNFNFNPDTEPKDELLLRQVALTGISDIIPTRAGKFVFLPNGLLNSNNNRINVVGRDETKRGICISKPGRIRYVADSADCTD